MKQAKINNNVVFVSGAYNGAIYDFNNNKIYSVNHEANSFLLRFLESKKAETKEEKEYIFMLQQSKLIDKCYKFIDYAFDTDKVNKLKFVWLEITQACNLKCIHCYEGDTHKSCKDRLSVNDWKRIIKELYDCECTNIQFIGGEPSCYKDVIELIDYAGSFGFKSIGFFTNATLIDDSLLECLVRNKVKVKVSLYGDTAELHNSITLINGSFEKTVQAIQEMLKRDIDIEVAITVMRENQEYYERIVQFLKALGVKKHKFDLVREVCDCNQNCHLCTRDDLIKKKYRTEPKFSISKNWFEKAFNQNTCWYGKFAITEHGDVIPCVFERNILLGNLKEQTISNLLKSEQLNQFWRLDFSQIEECKDCEYRYACKDCRPLGLLNGGLYKKNSRCKYHPLIGKWE